ncbi:MAG TPA: hypothetical protein VFW90_01580 [Candidatus Saccharimonadales bacterium]|nr:hypothetical protein [Candidatus Saccharimonadales bacterium]
MSVGEGRSEVAESGRNAGRMRKIAEAVGSGALGLATVAVAEAFQVRPEISFFVGGIVFLLAYNGLRNSRRPNADN